MGLLGNGMLKRKVLPTGGQKDDDPAEAAAAAAEDAAKRGDVKMAFSKPAQRPPPAEVQLELTRDELAKFDATNPDEPVYIAVKGVIYDASSKRESYVPGASYNCFAGKDCARALATMSLKPENCVPDIDGLTPEQLKILDDWVTYYADRYPVVGRVVDSPKSGAPPADGAGDDKDGAPST